MKLGYRPELDGLRALAALAVLLGHSHVPGFVFGGYGVSVFFVLSGYLITTLLAEEANRGAIDVPGFWMRRVRRLVPALLVMVAATVAFTPWLMPRYQPVIGGSALAALSYTMNIAPFFGNPMNPLRHTWTLALEMQFYLLWPLVMAGLLRLRSPVVAPLIVWMLLAAAGWVLGGAGDFLLAQIAGVRCLVIGAVVALLPAARPGLGWLGAICVLVATFVPGALGDQLRALPALEIGAALLVSGLRHPSRLSRALSWGPLAYLGLISYGVYLWHAPIALALHAWPWWWRVLVTAVSSTALAALSFHSVEAWAKRLGRAAPARPRTPRLA